MQRLYRLLLWLCTLGVAAMIFGFSAQSGEVSGSVSGRVVAEVIDLVDVDYSTRTPAEQESIYSFVDHLVRKAAHFAEYALLGFFLRLLAGSYRWRRPTRLCLLLGALYAGTDEVHQLFIAQRAAMWQDVLLDSTGVLAGITLAYALLTLNKRWKERKTHETDGH